MAFKELLDNLWSKKIKVTNALDLRKEMGKLKV
jgi:hypothetical protein